MSLRRPQPEPPTRTPTPSVPAGERIYAIGDIHGRLDLLDALVARIRRDDAARPPARTRLILLGDLIDRGGASAELVEQCRGLAARSDAFVVLKGNHEAMLLDSLHGNLIALALWLRSGGDAALRSWGVAEALIAAGPSLALIAEAKARIPAETLLWLERLPARHRAGDYLFVHAGIRPGVALDRQSQQDMLWIRGDFLDSEADHGAVVVHGHSIIEGVAMRPNRIGIDTGAYRTGLLTALALEGDRRWTLATTGADASARPPDTTSPCPAGRLERDVAALLGLAAAADPVPPDVPPGAGRRARAILPAALLLATSAVVTAMLVRPWAAPPRHDAPVARVIVPAGRVTPPRDAPAPAIVRAKDAGDMQGRRAGVRPSSRSAVSIAPEPTPPPESDPVASPPPPPAEGETAAGDGAADAIRPITTATATQEMTPPPRTEAPTSPAAPPPQPPIADAQRPERIGVQRSIDAIRTLRKQ